MYKGHTIGVVVPAFNEQELILETLGGMPDYVDRIFVVDDASVDATARLIQEHKERDPRVVLIRHQVNQGLGSSLIDGYLASRNSEMDITAVMAGDNQMHPDDLPGLLEPIVKGEADYVKGNRLLHANVDAMPRYRFLGNALLTLLTKFATGYYSLMDPQCGYTTIRLRALQAIPIASMTRGYGYNADILCMLNILRFKVTDVEVQPVYGREQSKIKLRKYIPATSLLLARLFLRRLWKRYVVLDFHPLVLFYLFSVANLFLVAVPLLARFIYLYRKYGEAPRTTLIILVLALVTGFQSMLFAIWMDMDYNRR
ncbi:MAG: glycosyltransferase family 2 protein [Acidobacteriota bacterium]